MIKDCSITQLKKRKYFSIQFDVFLLLIKLLKPLKKDIKNYLSVFFGNVHWDKISSFVFHMKGLMIILITSVCKTRTILTFYAMTLVVVVDILSFAKRNQKNLYVRLARQLVKFSDQTNGRDLVIYYYWILIWDCNPVLNNKFVV